MFDIPHKEEFIQTSIVYGSLSIVFVLCQIFFYVKMRESPQSKNIKCNFGVAAYPVATFLLRFGLTLSLLTLVLGFAFLPVCNEHSSYMICNSFLNLQSIVFPILFTYFVLAFTIDTLMVPWFNYKAAQSIHLVGDEKVYLSMCYRGPLLCAVAKNLNEGDPWNSDSCKISPEWAIENCRREHIPLDRIDIQNGDARRLDGIADGEMDVVINNSMSFAYPNEDFSLVAFETDRILKTGGKLVVIQTIFGDDLGELMFKNGYTIIYEQVIFKLPLPLKVTTAVKKSRDHKQYLEKKEDYEFEKQFMIPIKPYVLPVYSSFAPHLTFLISLCIFGLFCYLLENFWFDIDIPRNLDSESYNRLSSGFISSSVLWAGYAMIENFRLLREGYATNEIKSLKALFVKYLNFLVLASLWNIIWWLPGFLFDLYVAPKVPSVPVAFWNIMLAYVIFYTLAKSGQAMREYGLKQKKKARLEKRHQLTSIQTHDTDIVNERVPLLTK